jgi:DUF1009 family protein
MQSIPTELGIIAGKGSYPLLLAESARAQGVSRLVAVAFRKETNTTIENLTDETHWVHIGQLEALLEALKTAKISQVVMAGQITPSHLFNVRMDKAMLSLLKRLKTRNAETIFSAVAEELQGIGVELLPASSFMASHMTESGLLSARPPTEREQADIKLGMHVAHTTSGLDIGQTVVIKQGTVIAVEAFEGTDDTILRAGELAGDKLVVVKVAKPGHDMRFDIPVVGEQTLQTLKKAKASALAVEAGRAILLERDKLIQLADRMNLCFLVVDPTDNQEAA